MRVLLVNHGTAADWGGGDGVQMRETGKRLAARGHQVELVNADRFNPRGFDLVHIFNCRVHHCFEQQVASCLEAGVPFVVSPIWVSIAKAIWGSRGSISLLNKAVDEGEHDAGDLLNQLKLRKLTVMLPDGSIEATGAGSWDQSGIELVSRLIQKADGLLPNSWLELQAVRSDLHWVGDCFEVAHYGVDPKLFLDADPRHFRERYGVNGIFVLQAGRIEPAKNQAMLCWALRDLDIKIILIGRSEHWPNYRDLCKKISGDRLMVIDHLDQNMLASAYAAAAVHTLPSWMETCGLVSLEAALCGTPLVGSTFGHELEYLENDAWYADPANPASIRNAVIQAIEAGRHNVRPIRMKRKVLERFNWEQSTDSTERLYQRVLANRRLNG